MFNEFRVADEKTCKASWSGVRNGALFFCAFCGHKFVVGDEYTMVYTNDTDAPGNPLTCKPCFEKHGRFDEEGGWQGLRKEWVKIWEEYKTRFKWFYERDRHQGM